MKYAEYFILLEALTAERALNPHRFVELLNAVDVPPRMIAHLVLLTLTELDAYSRQVTDAVIRTLVEACSESEHVRAHTTAMVAMSWVADQEDAGHYHETWRWIDARLRSIEYVMPGIPPQRISSHRSSDSESTVGILRRGHSFFVHVGPRIDDTQDLPAITDEVLRTYQSSAPGADTQIAARA